MIYQKNIDFIKNEVIRKKNSGKRTLVKNSVVLPKNALFGKVVELSTKLYVVEFSGQNGEAENLNCFVAGSLTSPHKHSTLVCCGDNVNFIKSDDNQTGTILEVVERNSKLSRLDPANKNREHVVAANIDTLLIFMSVLDPMINFRLIDRLLVASMLGNLNVAICINKSEIAETDELTDLFEPYILMGIPLFLVSMFEQSGVEPLYEFLKDKDTVVAGMSGVGKSTLLNTIFGCDVQKVLEVSESSGKGRHTTSFVKRFHLPFGGFITDTPGIREFGLWDLAPDELCLFFPDFNEYYPDCKYFSCTHTHEPGCKVKEAVENGDISQERYISYLNILESLEEFARNY